MTHTILHADLLAYLRGNQWMAQNGYIEKAHAILCDPPYALPGGFMSKDWDAFHSPQAFQAWVSEWAGLLIDFVHPGAVGLFFGGTRTYHRLAAGLEDAGWDVTDCIMWVHAQGFPKSMDLSKALDREAGAAREVVGSKGLFPDIRGNSSNGRGMSGPANEGRDRLNVPITAPATPLAARWSGYGTSMKPAWEPCVVCRAPRGKRTYAALAREFGTGALAIDAARIPSPIAEDFARPVNHTGIHEGWDRPWKHDPEALARERIKRDEMEVKAATLGRWPANFALVCACESDDHAADCPVAVLGEQSGVSVSRMAERGKGIDGPTFKNANGADYGVRGHDDVGSAARFFYQAKAAAWEREAGLNTTQHVWYNKADGNGGQTWVSTVLNQSTPAASDTPPRRGITDFRYGTARLNAHVSYWPTTGYGNKHTARSRRGIRYIIGTGTSKTIASKILSLSIPPRTSASIAGANSATVSGGNHARSAESSSPLMPSIGISAKRDGLYTASADLAISHGSSRESKTADDQGRKNKHPCIKPIRLAEYLARLILPPELDEPRRLLVPFAGSGSEMIGALLAGWDVVTGIEREAEYVDLARARVGWWAQFGTYDEARAAYEKERKARPVIIPAPIVVVEDKPAQLALFEQEAAS